MFLNLIVKCLSFCFTSEHAAELGNSVPEKPLLFMKPTSAYVREGDTINVPMNCKSLHHEIELGVVIGSQCRRVAAADVMNHVGGYCLVS